MARQRMHAPWIVLLLLQLPAVSCGVTSSFSPDTKSSLFPSPTRKTRVIHVDASYQSNEDTSSLISWIRQSLQQQQQQQQLASNKIDNHDQNDSLKMKVNVCSSALGDDALKSLVSDLLSTPALSGKEYEENVEVELDARMNQLTNLGLSHVLTTITAAMSDATQLQPPSNTTTTNTTISNNNQTQTRNTPYLSSLDLGFNHVGSGPGYVQALRRLVGNQNQNRCFGCPRTLRLDRCGIGPEACRAMAKGLMNRQPSYKNHNKTPPQQLLHLHLSGNPAIQNAGAAALAAALRTCARHTPKPSVKTPPLAKPVLETLDLSSCAMGNAGVQALALALADSPGCVQNLHLSNNEITDDGVVCLCRALLSAASKTIRENEDNDDNDNSDETSKKRQSSGRACSCLMESLDLSNHKHITDVSATALAAVMARGLIKSISLRSCHVRAEGALALGRALVAFAAATESSYNHQAEEVEVEMDLSGNLLGIHHQNKKHGSGSSSSTSKLFKSKTATALTQRATKQTSKYVNLLGAKLKQGWQDAVGGRLEVDSFLPKHDDEEEEEFGLREDSHNEEEEEEENDDETVDWSSFATCGARSFAQALLDAAANHEKKPSNNYKNKLMRCTMSMRQCALDRGAANALAAAILQARQGLRLDIRVDASMNEGLTEEQVQVLAHGWSEDESDEDANNILMEMAQRHLQAVEALQFARQRAQEAAEAAAARARAESAFGTAWSGDVEGEDGDYDDWDGGYEEGLGEFGDDEYDDGGGGRFGYDEEYDSDAGDEDEYDGGF